MAEHSPGPWMTHEVWVREVATDNMVADCMGDDSIDAATARANARLIARSPALLEALRELLDAAGDCVSDPDGLFPDGHNWPPYQRLLAACVAASRAIAGVEGTVDG